MRPQHAPAAAILEGLSIRTISADLGDVRGPHDKSFRRCVGGGHAMLDLRADYREHLTAGRQLCGFEYLRRHGLLHDDMGVYREDVKLWVKDADGEPVPGRMALPEGWYALPMPEEE